MEGNFQFRIPFFSNLLFLSLSFQHNSADFLIKSSEVCLLHILIAKLVFTVYRVYIHLIRFFACLDLHAFHSINIDQYRNL